MSAKAQTKTFGKSTREVPASSDKARKWYPADDESEPKQVSSGDYGCATGFLLCAALGGYGLFGKGEYALPQR